MVTARDRLLTISTLAPGNPARDHIQNVATSIIVNVIDTFEVANDDSRIVAFFDDLAEYDITTPGPVDLDAQNPIAALVTQTEFDATQPETVDVTLDVQGIKIQTQPTVEVS